MNLQFLIHGIALLSLIACESAPDHSKDSGYNPWEDPEYIRVRYPNFDEIEWIDHYWQIYQVYPTCYHATAFRDTSRAEAIPILFEQIRLPNTESSCEAITAEIVWDICSDLCSLGRLGSDFMTCRDQMLVHLPPACQWIGYDLSADPPHHRFPGPRFLDHPFPWSKGKILERQSPELQQHFVENGKFREVLIEYEKSHPVVGIQ